MQVLKSLQGEVLKSGEQATAQHQANMDSFLSLVKELDETFNSACPDNAECLEFQLETED